MRRPEMRLRKMLAPKSRISRASMKEKKADPEKEMKPLQRYRGCLMGLAAGDALGAAIEFEAPGSFRPSADGEMT